MWYSEGVYDAVKEILRCNKVDVQYSIISYGWEGKFLNLIDWFIWDVMVWSWFGFVIFVVVCLTCWLLLTRLWSFKFWLLAYMVYFDEDNFKRKTLVDLIHFVMIDFHNWFRTIIGSFLFNLNKLFKFFF